MAKNILVPIDFNVASLNTLKIALDTHKNEEINVLLIYAYNLSNSITELLFQSPRKIIQSLTNNEFEDALSILKNSYESNLKALKIELFYGSNAQAISNFSITKKIDLIYIPQRYRLVLKKNGFNPLPLIKNSKIPFKEVSWDADQNTSDTNTINQLFI